MTNPIIDQKEKNQITSLLISMAFMLIIGGLVALFLNQLSSKTRSQTNNAYIRTIACIVTIPATTRTQADIENCYKTVEQKTGVILERNIHD